MKKKKERKKKKSIEQINICETLELSRNDRR
jgi:hypothetical protein